MKRLARDVKRRFVSTVSSTQTVVDQVHRDTVLKKSAITKIRTEFPSTVQAE